MGFNPPKPPKPDPETKLVQAKPTRTASRANRDDELTTASTRLARKTARGSALGGAPA